MSLILTCLPSRNAASAAADAILDASLAIRASVGSSALQSPGVVQREDIEQNSKE